MEITGILKAKFDIQTVSERFQKREFVLTTETNTPYPQHISLQMTQDKCGILDQFHEGEELRVQFNVRGREWNGPQGTKYFNTLDAWRVERVQAASTTTSAPTPAQPTPIFTPPTDDNDDLPF